MISVAPAPTPVNATRGALVLRLALPVALALLVGVLGACAGGGAAPAPLSTTLSTVAPSPTAPTPSPDPPPPPPPPTLGAARRYERNGQQEEAIAAYEAIVASAEGSQQRQARLALARTYLASGRYTEAQRQLATYVQEETSAEELARGYFLLAQADIALGRALGAAAALQRYIDLGGAAAPHAHLALGQGLQAVGLPELALSHFQEALAEELSPEAQDQARLALARAYQQAGQDEAALAQYRLIQDGGQDASGALALWRTADIRRDQGDRQAWQEALELLVWRYPEYQVAADALAQLAAADIASDPFAEGMVYYRQRHNREALAAFQGYLKEQPDGPHAAAAHFYAAATHERLGENDRALEEYAAASQTANPLADDALWWRGRLLEELERYDEAAAVYGRLAALYPLSPWAAEAGFRLGFLPYRRGDLPAAEEAWSALAVTAFLPRQAARAHLWLGKLAQEGDQGETAEAHWARALELAPSGFYGLRAEVLLATQQPTPPRPATTPSAETDAEAWLMAQHGPEDPAARRALFADRRWRAGLELALLGRPKEAQAELRSLIDAHKADPWALYRLAEALAEEGLTSLSARAASRLADSHPNAPRAVLRLAYPQDYHELVQAAAAENGLAPLLLLALIRQESFYDPAAVSSANALGLTQVIPSTGREIAGRLSPKATRQGEGYREFEPRDLLRPVVGIEFGAAYLGWQLALFDGNPYYALAAYNGGPGSALRWSRRGTLTDVDLFLEEIDFEETRRYVELVTEYYSTYRYLYGEAPRPSLVRQWQIGR